jgi:uncharacterized membrane protein YhaH (DUF805 family)
MTFTQAVKTCFRKYITFSGRASRSEYWWFFLFIILGSIVAGFLDALLFGAGSYEAEISDTSAGLTAESDGPLATVFSLATVIPSIAAGWRRMHDSGRSGLYLLYPLIAMIGVGSFAAITGAMGGLLPGPDVPATDPSGLILIVLILAGIVLALSPLFVLWWLTRPSTPGPNPYGPNPHEVFQ